MHTEEQKKWVNTRWRKDKKVEDINTLDDLKMMLKFFNEQYSSSV